MRLSVLKYVSLALVFVTIIAGFYTLRVGNRGLKPKYLTTWLISR